MFHVRQDEYFALVLIPSSRPCIKRLVTLLETQQLSEKLDSVRERAGTVLQKLVLSSDPQLPFVPERAAVKHAITHGAEGMGASVPGGGGAPAAAAGVEIEEAVNWASPAATFPMVVGLLAVPEYHDAIGESESETNLLHCWLCFRSNLLK